MKKIKYTETLEDKFSTQVANSESEYYAIYLTFLNDPQIFVLFPKLMQEKVLLFFQCAIDFQRMICESKTEYFCASDAFHPYSGNLLGSLLDPDFQSSCKIFLNDSSGITLKKNMNAFGRNHVRNFSREQTSDFVFGITTYLAIYRSYFIMNGENHLKLLKAGRDSGVQLQQFNKSLCESLAKLMLQVKAYIEKNNSIFKNFIDRDIELIRDHLKDPSFASGPLSEIEVKNVLETNHLDLGLQNGPWVMVGDELKEVKERISLEVAIAHLEKLEERKIKKISVFTQSTQNIIKSFIRACQLGKLKKVKQLYEEIPDEKLGKAVYVACERGHECVVKYLISKISDKRSLARKLLNEFDATHKTPLMVAAANGHIEVIETLAKCWVVDFSLSNSSGKTALSLSSNENIRKVIEARLTSKASIIYKDLPEDFFQREIKIGTIKLFDDTSEMDLQEIKTYFLAVHATNMSKQLLQLCETLKPYCQYLESKEDPSSKTFKWSHTYKKLFIAIKQYQSEEDEILKNIVKTDELGQLRQLRKEHLQLVKKMNAVKKNLEELNSQLVAWDIDLPDSTSGGSNSRVSLSSSSSSSSSSSVISDNTSISEFRVSQTRVNFLTNLQKNPMTVAFTAPLQPLPIPHTLSDYIDHMLLNDFCREKLGNIDQFSSLIILDTQENKTILQAMQIDAILFETMQLMLEAGFYHIRTALVHCRGLFPFSYDEKTVAGLHKEVMSFARCLLTSRKDWLANHSFYLKLEAHSENLKYTREIIDEEERPAYTSFFINKTELYAILSKDIEVGIIKKMGSAARQMVNIHSQVYGISEHPEEAVVLRHTRFFKYDSKPISSGSSSSNSSSFSR